MPNWLAVVLFFDVTVMAIALSSLVMIDVYEKWLKIREMRKGYTEKQMAKLLCDYEGLIREE